MSEEQFQTVAKKIEAASKIVRPVWLLFASAVGFAFWFGSFQYEYRRNAEEGSPALNRLVSEQRVWNAGQAVTNARLEQIVREQERRITKLEDRE
jgi:hypothetical protein